MNHVAKSRVGIAKDGKTLVDADGPESAFLFAAKGSTVPEKKLTGKDNVAKFFKREGEQDAEKEDTSARKRVEPEPEPVRHHAPKIHRK